MTEDFIANWDKIASSRIDTMFEAAFGDPEIAHGLADQIVIDLLRNLGLTKTAEAWERVEPKWYA